MGADASVDGGVEAGQLSSEGYWTAGRGVTAQAFPRLLMTGQVVVSCGDLLKLL